MGLNKKEEQNSTLVLSTNNIKQKKSNVFIELKDYFISGLLISLEVIKYVFFCFWSGLNIIILNPLKGGTNHTARLLDDAYQTTKKAVKIEKEPTKTEQALDKFWKSTPIYKKKKVSLEKEKAAFQSILNSEEGVKRSEKPITYRYKVLNPKGKIEQDTFIGVSIADANAFLVNEGYEVISIKTSKQIEFFFGAGGIGAPKLKTKDLIFWLTQLSTYIKSGIPLTDSMRILSKQMGKEQSKKRLFDSIIYELTLGESFSQALAKQGSVFPPLLINMLKAAEATGELEETLDDMANYYTEIDKTRRQMVSAMTYPALVSVFAIGVVSFILLYVVPQFTEIYENSGIQIQGLTLFVINFANFLKKNIFIIIMFVVLIVFVVIILYKNIKAFRREAQVFLMHLPVIKNIIIYNEITIFTKTFASLLKNNVFITESIDILSKITSNEIYKEIMYETINNIAKGDKISESFYDHWAVPDVAYYMIVTGESTGELASMMDRVSKYYQELHTNTVATLKSFIEPILIAVLAVIVGGVILAVIIPMFDLYSQVSL